MGDSQSSPTTISPLDNMLQIEHALTAVGSGQALLGIKAANGVVIATEKQLPSILVDETSVQKTQSLAPNVYRTDNYWDDPILEDGFGHITNWKLSDLEKAFDNHLKNKMNEPGIKEKKLSKLEKLKCYNDRMEQYMKACLSKYNSEENLNEDLCFKFVKGLKESLIIEGGWKVYHHFNFEAIHQSEVSVFFSEVIRHKEDVEVTCCTILRDYDNATCLGCTNQGDRDLKHPTSDNAQYVGGHVNCKFLFLVDSDSEDESD